MANTAIRAARPEVTRTITFKDQKHEVFYKEHLPKCRYQDVYQEYCI